MSQLPWEFPAGIQMSNMWAFFDKPTRKSHRMSLPLLRMFRAVLQSPYKHNIQNGLEPFKAHSHVSDWMSIFTHHRTFISNIVPWGYNLQWSDLHHHLLPFCQSLNSQPVLVEKKKKGERKTSYARISLNVPFIVVHLWQF